MTKNYHAQPYARQHPDHQTTWRPTRPELAIRCLRSTSTNRGYHESHYEIVSFRALDDEDVARIEQCGLLGSGQQWDIVKRETFIEDVPPVTISRLTGEVLPDVPPTNWNGEPITDSHAYEWHRVVVRRICDSGD